MDVARYIEETGVLELNTTEEGPYITEFLDRDDWATLCAGSFFTNNSAIGAQYTAARSNIKAKTYAAKAAKDQQALLNNPNAKNEASNEFSKTELVYKKITNKDTGSSSLVPYICVQRLLDVYSYKFYDKSMSDTEDSKDYSNILRAGKGQGNAGAKDYILDNIYILEANSELNQSNIAVHKKGASSSSKNLDITASYPASPFFEKTGGNPVNYEIPLKTLIDRYMPKAVLLSSWYMLKQNETTKEGDKKSVDEILEQIKAIYDEACLKGETLGEDNWLLVKSVKTQDGNYSIGNAIKMDAFTKQLEEREPLDEYHYKLNKSGVTENVSTDLIFGAYNPKFDFREGDPNNTQNTTQNNTQNNNQQNTANVTTTQTSLLGHTEQKFGGTLADDLKDDIELILNQYEKDNNGVTFTEKQYEKLMKDVAALVSGVRCVDLISINSKYPPGYFTIYEVDSEGKYVIDCTKLNESLPIHHDNKSGGTHKEKYGHELDSEECKKMIYNEHLSPYGMGAHPECFKVFMKVALASIPNNRKAKDGETPAPLKSVAAVIYNNGLASIYRVDEREVEDVAGITNKETFIKFGREKLTATNLGDWDESCGAPAEDRTYFIVDDLVEAIPILNERREWSFKLHFEDESDYYSLVEILSYAHEDKNDPSSDYVTIYDTKEKVFRELNAMAANVNEKVVIKPLPWDVIKDIVLSVGVPKDAIIEAGSLGILRPGATSADYDTTPPKNAATQDVNYNNGLDATDGESEFLKYMYLDRAKLVVAGKDEDTIKKEISDGIVEKIKEIYGVDISDFEPGDSFYDKVEASGFCDYNYKLREGNSGTSVHGFYSSKKVKDPRSFISKMKRWGQCTYAIDGDKADIFGDATALFTVKKRVVTITQQVKHREMVAYMPTGDIKTWSSIKTQTNTIQRKGEFDPTLESNGGYMQLIPRTRANTGVCDITVNINRKWRLDFYEKYFRVVRENDVLAMISEWETAGERGQFAAYTYIRDLYALINYSKNEIAQDGNPYVDKDSYSYLYIPEETLNFDETITDKAFWLERLLAAPGKYDQINQEENYTMRNSRAVKTWQIVDYDQYEECKIPDSPNDANVYAGWVFGGYLGKSLYAFEANAHQGGNSKIRYWGNYIGPGVHSGVDLYGRSNAAKIYSSSHQKDEPYITAKWNGDGTVTMTYGGTTSVKIGKSIKTASVNGTGEEGNNVSTEEANDLELASSTASIHGNNTLSSYMGGNVVINIDGTEVTFDGTGSAVYGYELYRLTKAYRNGEAAQKVIDEELKKEISNHALVAVAPGIVTDVGGSASGGFSVSISYGPGSSTFCCHMKRWPEVQVGEYVGAGTILGYEGTTGNSGGPHIHIEFHSKGRSYVSYPIQYLYPFFTPFYNEEKAFVDGERVELESEYLSLQRTVYPVGEKIPADVPLTPAPYKVAGEDVIIEQVERDENGIIKLKNYVPSKPLCLYSELPSANEGKSYIINELEPTASKAPTVKYSGESVIALPQYFDEKFMSAVRNNGGHILISQ